MTKNTNDAVTLALRDATAAEGFDAKKEISKASAALFLSIAILDAQADGIIAPLAEWMGKPKVHGEIVARLLGEERTLNAENARKVMGKASKATPNEKAKASAMVAEYDADKARLKELVPAHEAAMMLYGRTGVTWKRDNKGETVLFPAAWFFPYGDKPEQAAEFQPLVQYVTASRTKGFAELETAPAPKRGKVKHDADCFPSYLPNENEAEYREVSEATPNAKTALAGLLRFNKSGANVAAMIAAAKPKATREQSEEQAPAVPVPEAASALASSLAAADYEISGEAADAFLDLVAAFIAASDSNRSAIAALLNEGAKAADSVAA